MFSRRVCQKIDYNGRPTSRRLCYSSS